MTKQNSPQSQMQPRVAHAASLPHAGMLPRSFVCSVCTAVVAETIYGGGFRNCGMVQATSTKWLCAECMAKVIAFLEEMKIGRR
jgi:hypothetical protein